MIDFKTTFKLLMCLTILFTTWETTIAQNTVYENNVDYRKAYIGFGMGINHYTGIIGVNVEVPVHDKIALMGTAGLGTWGTKLGISARYYLKDVRGKSLLSAGISRAKGMDDIKMELEVYDGSEQDVIMDWEQTVTINLAYVYAINLRDKNKITFTIGYAVPLKKDSYTITSGHVLSDTSESVMNIMKPGGLSLGVDFLFGVGKRY